MDRTFVVKSPPLPARNGEFRAQKGGFLPRYTPFPYTLSKLRGVLETQEALCAPHVEFRTLIEFIGKVTEWYRSGKLTTRFVDRFFFRAVMIPTRSDNNLRLPTEQMFCWTEATEKRSALILAVELQRTRRPIARTSIFKKKNAENVHRDV